MLEDPGLDPDGLTVALGVAYGIDASGLAFIPTYDPRSASYEVTAEQGRYFLKVRFDSTSDAAFDAAFDVPRALLEAGVPNILAPMRTLASGLWVGMGDRSLVLYPFVSGQNAMVAGLSREQWRTFGATLRAVHESGLERGFADRLPIDAFTSTAGDLVIRMSKLAQEGTFESAAARHFAGLWRDQAGPIRGILERAQELGTILRSRSFERVLCHADIHAANILVRDDGICLVDWDGPMIAPRERDLLFVIGSRIARRVEPHEEAWFFEGYGDVAVDAEAIVYYRYERILEDLGEFAASVLLDDTMTEVSRESQTDLVATFFAPGGMLDDVERVRGPSRPRAD